MRGCLYYLLLLVTFGSLIGLSAWLGTRPPETLTPFQQLLFDNLGLLYGLLLAIAAAGWALAAARRHRREEAAWDAFASRHGLTRGGPEQVSGRVGGREVILTSFRSGQQDSAGRYQSLTVALQSPPVWVGRAGPVDGLLRPALGTLRQLATQLGREPATDTRVVIGDEALDGRLHITADLVDTARAWLTPARLQALDELISHDGHRFQPGALVWTREDRSQDPAELSAALERLLALAARLEGDQPGGEGLSTR